VRAASTLQGGQRALISVDCFSNEARRGQGI
jgi:hypothetical protein